MKHDEIIAGKLLNLLSALMPLEEDSKLLAAFVPSLKFLGKAVAELNVTYRTKAYIFLLRDSLIELYEDWLKYQSTPEEMEEMEDMRQMEHEKEQEAMLDALYAEAQELDYGK